MGNQLFLRKLPPKQDDPHGMLTVYDEFISMPHCPKMRQGTGVWRIPVMVSEPRGTSLTGPDFARAKGLVFAVYAAKIGGECPAFGRLR